MKPNDRNRVMCPDCGKAKMQFESERKAQDFIKWNADDLPLGGHSLRVYYCKACCCWHISHKQYSSGYGRQFNDKMKAYEQQRGNSGARLDKLIRGTDLETAIRLAQEIYPKLKMTHQPRSAVKTIIHNFLIEHKEYHDSPALRSEILDLYNKDGRKKKTV